MVFTEDTLVRVLRKQKLLPGMCDNLSYWDFILIQESLLIIFDETITTDIEETTGTFHYSIHICSF